MSRELLDDSGKTLPQLIGHEGSHGADRKAWQAAVVQETDHGAALNRTTYDTEMDAYRVSASVAEGAYAADQKRRLKPAATTNAGHVLVKNRNADDAPDNIIVKSGKKSYRLWDTKWTEEERVTKRDDAIREVLRVPTKDGGLYGVTQEEPGKRFGEEN